MKKVVVMRFWLTEQCEWPDIEELDATVKIFCNLEPSVERIRNYYDITKIIIAPEGDYPTPTQLREAYPYITDIGIISMYDSFLKFDKNMGYTDK